VQDRGHEQSGKSCEFSAGAAFEEERGAAEGEDGEGGGVRNFPFGKHDGGCGGKGHGRNGFGAGHETEDRRQGGERTMESHEVPAFKVPSKSNGMGQCSLRLAESK
jgi:hypothetical protein